MKASFTQKSMVYKYPGFFSLELFKENYKFLRVKLWAI